jgi:hypothetical protein
MSLRIDNVFVKSTTRIDIVFTDDINPSGIGPSNFIITTETGLLETLSIVDDPIIDGNTIILHTKPQKALFLYKLEVVNLPDAPVRRLSDGAFLLQDGSANVKYFYGVRETNEIQTDLSNAIRPMSIYDIDNPNTTVYNTLSSIADQLLKARRDIRTADADNYLCVRVVDEEVVRGSGPGDRLQNEGVFLVERVGRSRTGIVQSDSIEQIALDGDIISLHQKVVTDEIVTSNGGFIFSVNSGPVIELVSLTLTQTISGNSYDYDIQRFRYFLNNNRYDHLAFSLLTLEENQIQLSEEAALARTINDDIIFPRPVAGDTIRVTYKYRAAGRKVQEDSVNVTQIIRNFKEALPFVATRFFLSHAPIINSAALTSHVRDPLSTVSFIGGNTSLVFVTELDFLTDTPLNEGEYAINYVTGEVVVGGSPQIGTTNEAGQIEYDYLNEFTEGLDFNVDFINGEITFNSTRNLNGQIVDIDFSFEEVFQENIDYQALTHVEVIDERVNNKLIGDLSLKTLNTPITSVRRVFNETTGEIYTVDRFNNTTIFFSGRNAPRKKNAQFERVKFSRIARQDILASATLATSVVGGLIFKTNFSTPEILNQNFTKVGANFDTSVLISNSDPLNPFFVNELYYDDNLILIDNLNKFTSIGDYLIDYTNAILYIVVPSATDIDTRLGTISYRHNVIETKNAHIISVLDLNKRISSRESPEIVYTPTNVQDSTLSILDLEKAGEFATSALDGAETITVQNTISALRNIYTTTTISGITVPDFSSPLDLTGIEFDDNIIDFSNASFSLSLGQDVFVDYEYGSIFLSYQYLADELLVTYEYGDNTIDWSVGSVFDNINRRRFNFSNSDCTADVSLDTTTSDRKYYVTYQYGASREALIDNFGKLTNVPFLSENLPVTFNREKYRNSLKGLFASFVLGPTIPSIKQLVKHFTLVDPNIIERVFQELIVGKTNLNPSPPIVTVSGNRIVPTDENTLEAAGINFGAGCFGEGMLLTDGITLSMPFNSNFPLDEGTLEFCTKPQWNGLENDASITFDFTIDGYGDGYDLGGSIGSIINQIYIGTNNTNPDQLPFTLNKITDSFVLGPPTRFLDGSTAGIFVWYDTFANRWMFKARNLDGYNPQTVRGNIKSSSEFSSVLPIIISSDGYDSYGCGDGYSIPDGYRLEYGFGTDFDGYDSYTLDDFGSGSFTLLVPPSTGSILVSDYVIEEATGGGADWVNNEFPGGVVNGINTSFTVANSYIAGSLRVYRDGIRLLSSTDYIETPGGFTMSSPPSIGTILLVDYIILSGSSPLWRVGETPSGLINGVNMLFLLANSQQTGTLHVFRDGVRLKPTEDYIEGPSEFLMFIPPSPGSILVVDYIDNSSIPGNGDAWKINVDPIGSINGINADFDLPTRFITGNLLVYKSGLRQRPILDFIESLNATIIPTPAGDFGFYGPDFIRSIADNEFEFEFFIGPGDIDGVNFRSDERHYFFDWGFDDDHNRLSVYKDGASYLNFEVKDRRRTGCDLSDVLRVSTDICDWVFGESHHIGISWRLNTAKEMDEMHLFVDGLEVPNLVRFGSRRSILGFKVGDIEEEVLIEDAIGTETFAEVVNTDLELERFAIFQTRDGYVTELAIDRDYTVDSYNNLINFIELLPDGYGGFIQSTRTLETDDRIALRTFGLTRQRILKKLFINGVVSKLKTGLPDPIRVPDVDLTAITLDGIPIKDGMVIRSDKTVTEPYRVEDRSSNEHNRQFFTTSFRIIQIISVKDRFNNEVYYSGSNDGRIRNAQIIELPSSSTVVTGDILTATYRLESPLLTIPTNRTSGRRLTLNMDGLDFVENLLGQSVEITVNGNAFDDFGGTFFTESIIFTEPATKTTDFYFTVIDNITIRIV